ncbi:MAG: 2-dehydro-3-deoxyglucarate aldolase [Chloroflexota bacterium]|jgi:2-dehydro-3-deoxyglucarate aldolase/4-hydroxy-2-oxoheptanedioate aldolase|nr:2-dehydro-3-deoxyglucarate aldolase [Chloroflexota bacterium]
MAAGSELRRRVLAGETLVGTFLNLGSPVAAEVCARAGFDWLLIDLEHGAGSEADLLPALWAARANGTPTVVRPEQGTRLRIGRLLDLGADGIMVPQVSNEEEAREVVSWLRFQPAGRRGVALFTRGLDYGTGGHDGVQPRNDEILGVLQVESAAAVLAAEEVAAIDGADVLFVGPTDLTHALGIPGQIDHPNYQAALERISVAARNQGKALGVLLWKPEDVRRYADLGFTFFAISSDGSLLDKAARAALDATRTALA